ncbi:MAG: hypothetical protein FJZ00_03610, partial [Candidatus Sericytochromatia bacterium]|nr:hypothetical protein [Candidatus Tanganyikabacteria bacterium]
RPIRHPALARAVDEAYSGHIPDTRHPIYVVSLTVDPRRVDFNVHPTKKEVRLADAAHHYSLIREAVGRALRQAPSVRMYHAMRTLGAEQPVGGPAAGPAGFEQGAGQPLGTVGHQPIPGQPPGRAGFQPALSGSRPAMPQPLHSAQLPFTTEQAMELYRPASADVTPLTTATPLGQALGFIEGNLTPGKPAEAREGRPMTEGREGFPWDDLRLLGQIHDTYLVLEHPEGLYLVDQHNSHERYLYEQIGAGGTASQELLIPRPLDLSPDAAAALAHQRENLAEIGFVVSPGADSGTWDLRAVPASLPSEEATQTLAAILDDLATGSAVPLKDLTDRWRVTVACHSAVKAGDRLTQPAMQRLLDQWRTCEQPFTCPHGRPTAVLIPLTELHRRCMRGMQTR